MMMAIAIYSGLIWYSFSLLIKPVVVGAEEIVKLKFIRKMRITGIIMIKLLLLNIFTGALVAGIDAGKVYNTWPLMNGQIIPGNAFEK